MMSLEQQISDVEKTILDYEFSITNCKDEDMKRLLLLNVSHLREERLLLLRAQQTTGKRIVPFTHMQLL